MLAAAKCPYCFKQFQYRLGPAHLSAPTIKFVCAGCSEDFTLENVQKIVWKRDPESQTYYTTLVSKFVEPDGKEILRFDYFD